MSRQQEFIQMLLPGALEASRITGLDPRLIIAQAAQETGWGKSAPGNNYFGIKSHGKGGGQTFKTHEYVNGKRVNINDSFRRYDSPADSALGYAEFLQQNPRYREMLAAPDMDSQIAALGRSGYATDPNYAQSVRNIATSIDIGGAQPFSPEQREFVQNNPQPGGFGPEVDQMMGQQPFGTMAPGGGGSSPFAIPPDVADYANSPEPMGIGDRLAGFGKGLDQAMEGIRAPRLSQPPGDARTSGNALTKFLSQPPVANSILQKRLTSFYA